MLNSLFIKNIAIFEEISVDFESGFHALTGETGAGKSILIDSVNLLLGSKASRDLIRSDEKSALVSAVFSISDETVFNILHENSIEIAEDEICISREIFKDGRNVCKIGSRPVTVSLLKEIGLLLINMHGQSENLSLYKKEIHIEYLDRFCHFEKQSDEYNTLYMQFHEQKAQVQKLICQNLEKEKKLEELSYTADELGAAKIVPGEEEKLKEQKRYFSNRERILKAVFSTYGILYDAQDGYSAYDLLKQAQREISQIADCDEEAQKISDQLEEYTVLIRDLAEDTHALSEGNDFSPEELEQLEERLDLISRLKRKYNMDESQLIELLQKTEEELSALRDYDHQLEKMQKQLQQKKQQLILSAETLSKMRKEMANILEKQIQTELTDLDMPNVTFKIQITQEEKDGEVRFFPDGIDVVEFMISPNAGENLKSISKIASGGEMARIMLAIKSVLSSAEKVDTLIFDEIDTGVSGRAAQKIAQKMYALAKNKQVMAVTHLPQIASMADHQYLISKSVKQERTFASIEKLEEKDRILEIARMTGGMQITDTTLSNAQEMLELARKFQDRAK